jgi:phage-related protein
MATELGKAYVQIIPSAQGISGSIEKAIGGEATSAGKSAGLDLVGALKGAIAAAGIGVAIKETLDAGGALQQSFGGLDTIYGEASEAAKKYAYEAQQAGISANDYAEQAVSFGASLKQAFEGDTTKAVEAANTAIMDMADNAAKMGTPIENIQTAYQGFAKQNYTMLDNLKLGYGGTKTEMERLLADAEKISGVKYDISNLGDVYDAIHVIQGELGLTGVAAAEASGTFTGSMGAMQAAAQNLMANLALGMDITAPMQQLVGNAITFVVNNLIPMLVNIVQGIPTALLTAYETSVALFQQGGMDTINNVITGITQALPGLLESGAEIVTNVLNGVMEAIPQLLDGASEMMDGFIEFIEKDLPKLLDDGVKFVTNIVNGILQNLPQIISSAGQLMAKFIEAVYKAFPQILAAGAELLVNIVQGIIQNLPEIAKAALDVATQIVTTIGENYPQFIQSGIETIGNLVKGLIDSIPDVISGIGQITSQALESFNSVDWASIGSNIISGIVSGISGAAGTLFSSLRGLA